MQPYKGLRRACIRAMSDNLKYNIEQSTKQVEQNKYRQIKFRDLLSRVLLFTFDNILKMTLEDFLKHTMLRKE